MKVLTWNLQFLAGKDYCFFYDRNDGKGTDTRVPREVTHRIDYEGRSWYVPCYHYDNYKIWGLTAVMIVELVNLAFDAGIDLERPPQPSVRIIKV